MAVVNPMHANGGQWQNYLCEYSCPEGSFGFYITAISREHAQLMLDDLKGSAVLKGEVMEKGGLSGLDHYGGIEL